MSYLLTGLQWVTDKETIRGNIRIADGRISEIGNNLVPLKDETVIHFENHFLYPGLINSHDHLEMNLYPRLGHPPYQNYVAWGNDIYTPGKSPIKEIERVDIESRLLWGGLKNLISGVTTCAHHNPWNRILAHRDFPVKVLNPAWAHSLAFGKNILNEFSRSQGKPFVIHAAEGTDAMATEEIEKLDKLGVLKSNTVLVHAVALTQKDLNVIAERNSAVVWCPESNNFLFNKTADIHSLKKMVRVALGSDSTLTGSSVMLDEMRSAHDTGLATPGEIFEMVTVRAADIFKINPPLIALNTTADLMITPQLHNDYHENLLQIHPSHIEAVFINGMPRFGDEKINDSLKLRHSFRVQGVKKKSTLDVPALLKKLIKKPGEEILKSNPLWNMITLS